MSLCPCQSGFTYAKCCQPFHLGDMSPNDAQQLMRSRYCAYYLSNIEYVVHTTLPAQQALLDRQAMLDWATQTKWCGLTIHSHQPNVSQRHSLVEFTAYFQTNDGIQTHDESALFVRLFDTWYFVDPNPPRPTAKHPCLCGSGKKFKHCCGAY